MGGVREAAEGEAAKREGAESAAGPECPGRGRGLAGPQGGSSASRAAADSGTAIACAAASCAEGGAKAQVTGSQGHGEDKHLQW